MDELALVRDLRSGAAVPEDARERVRARLLEVVGTESGRPPGSRRSMPVRAPLARLVGVGLAAAATVLGVLSAIPGAGPLGLFHDRAQPPVARAAAALSGPDGTIVHVLAIGAFTSSDGSQATLRIESWRQSSPPFDSRQIVTFDGGSSRPELATVEGVREFYDQRTNTIFILPAQQSTGKQAEPPARSDLDPLAPEFTLEKLRALLTSGRAREDGRTTLGGRDVIRIVTSSPRTTLLVDATTYKPIEWQVPAGDPLGQALTMHFRAYEWLPPTTSNKALLSLRAQHPEAAVRTAPIDRGETRASGK